MSPGPPPPIPAVPKAKTSSARKASPSRDDSEKTFQQKLDEIKRMRATSTTGPNAPERRRVIVNGKPSIAMCGDWALFASSSGRQYYFNLKTLVNQWQKPADWCDVQAGLVPNNGPPPLPAQLSNGPSGAPLPQSDSQVNGGGGGAGFKMKISHHGKKKLKNASKLHDEAEDENGAKSQRPPPADLTEDEQRKNEDDDNGRTSPKRSRRDSSASSYSSRSSHSSRSSRSSRSSYSSRSSSRGAAPVPMPDMNLVMAAKAKIESHMASIAAQYHSGPARNTNPTWLTEYNLPAVLARCKFPKAYDAIHELTTNRGKKRNPAPAPEFGGDQTKVEARRQLVITEVKNPNNRNRLLSEKLGITAFKIPDELWERHFPQFQIDLADGIKLECRPHAWTEDDKPVYTRTGKIAKAMPFPEDIVRCHAVVQAWATETCHCVYANKTYTIARDDNQWKKDLDECKKFLVDNGY